MSFKAEIVQIKKVESHPNADRLDLISIEGWSVVSSKGNYTVGSKGLYIPIDAVLPEEVESKIFTPDSKIKLDKHRVKTIKIRGAISQGLLVSLDTLGIDPNTKVGTDLTKKLGITKYEPPVNLNVGTLRATSDKQVNPNFHKYTKFDNMKNYPNFFQDGEEIIATEKIHGCLQANTMIYLADGSKKSIKDIVDHKLDVELLAFDNDKKEMTTTRVKNWFNNGSTNDWYNLTFTRKGLNRGNSFGSIKATANHKFYNLKRGEYVRLDELKVGDKVLLHKNKLELSFVQEQILIGKMLGDGSYSNRSISFSHKKEHESYLNQTISYLGNVGGNKQKESLSGYGTTMVRSRTISCDAIEELFKDWFTTGSKEVPKSIIGKLSPISLAYWYMDDGSLSYHEDQNDRACFATCNFSDSSVANLIDALKGVGLNAVVQYTQEYARVRLNADDAEKLFVLISPYIVPSMRYKLPERYRNLDFVSLHNYSGEYKPDTVEQTILSIDKLSIDKLTKINKNRYDIETETHNFVADGLVVHNSNWRGGFVPTVTSTLWKKIQKFLGILPAYEFVYGSHNVQLHEGNKKKIFYDQNIYSKMVKKYKLDQILEKGWVLYGEVYGSGVQTKDFNYGCADGEQRFIAFDLMIDGKYVDFDTMHELLTAKGIPVVPVLYRGEFSFDKAKELSLGASVLDPSNKVREGVVIKPFKETFSHIGGRKVQKFISDSYLMLKNNTDFH